MVADKVPVVEFAKTFTGSEVNRFRETVLSINQTVKDNYIQDKGGSRTLGAVVEMKQREGDIRVIAFDDRKAAPIKEAIHKHVVEGSRLVTDEAYLYRTGLEKYQHAAVMHSHGEWVRNDVHTNGVENFWSVMKRGVHGIYHQITYKYLQAYCNEFSFRYNTRKIKDAERFTLSLQHMEPRLT